MDKLSRLLLWMAGKLGVEHDSFESYDKNAPLDKVFYVDDRNMTYLSDEDWIRTLKKGGHDD